MLTPNNDLILNELMHCNIIGAGRLGKNIAYALSKKEIVILKSICNLSLDSAEQACLQIGVGNAAPTVNDLPPSDVIWITTNDDSIPSIVRQLSHTSTLKPGSLIIHCSGVLSSSLLSPFKELGCFVASIHPLKAFMAGYLDEQAFDKVDCVVEGDEEACQWLNNTFARLGANLLTIKPEAKSIYHAAACMVSNYLITLASCGEDLMLEAGIPSDQARHIIGKLMQGNIDNLQKTPDIAHSLTGPLMRGDSQTISLHLQSINNPEVQKLYKIAGLATLPLTQLAPEKKQAIERLLTN